jgi:hypothetical protein
MLSRIEGDALPSEISEMIARWSDYQEKGGHVMLVLLVYALA